MVRYVSALLAAVLGFGSVAHAASQKECKPVLAVTDVTFSEWQQPSMERRWTAKVSIDATSCQANSGGYFEMGFLRLKENGADLEFRERFIWLPPSTLVSVDFWADEAVQRYWIDSITPCPCRD